MKYKYLKINSEHSNTLTITSGLFKERDLYDYSNGCNIDTDYTVRTKATRKI